MNPVIKVDEKQVAAFDNDLGLFIDKNLRKGKTKFVLSPGKYFIKSTIHISKYNVSIEGQKFPIRDAKLAAEANILEIDDFCTTYIQVDKNIVPFKLNNANDFSITNTCVSSNNSDTKAGLYFIRTKAEAPSSNITLSNNIFYSIDEKYGLNNILFMKDGSQYLTFTDNVIYNLIGIGGSNGYGILCTGCSQSRITRNVFVGNSNLGRHAVYLSAGANNNLVDSNKVYNFSAQAISLGATETQNPVSNNTISNNEIYGGVTQYVNSGQITLFGNVSNNTITNNLLQGSSSYGILNNASFLNKGGRSSDNIISRNTFEDVGRAGIFLAGVDNVKVLKNTFKSFSTKIPGKYAGIWISSDISNKYRSENITVEENICFYNHTGRNCLRVAESKLKARNISINNNSFESFPKGTIDYEGTRRN